MSKEKNMDIIQYFESVYQAYADEDTDLVEQLALTQGMQDVKMKDVEQLVVYVLKMLGTSQRAIIEKEQIHFDILVNAIKELVGVLEISSGIDPRDMYTLQDIIPTLTKQDEDINLILDSAVDDDYSTEGGK